MAGRIRRGTRPRDVTHGAQKAVKLSSKNKAMVRKHVRRAERVHLEVGDQVRLQLLGGRDFFGELVSECGPRGIEVLSFMNLRYLSPAMLESLVI